MAKKNISISLDRKNKLTPYHLKRVNVPVGAKPIGLAVLYDEVTTVFLEADENQDEYEERLFLCIKVNEVLPTEQYKKMKLIGTAVIQKGHIIEQVYQVTE